MTKINPLSTLAFAGCLGVSLATTGAHLVLDALQILTEDARAVLEAFEDSFSARVRGNF